MHVPRPTQNLHLTRRALLPPQGMYYLRGKTHKPWEPCPTPTMPSVALAEATPPWFQMQAGLALRGRVVGKGKAPPKAREGGPLGSLRAWRKHRWF